MTGFLRTASLTVILALAAAVPLQAFAQNSETMLPPTVAGSTAICPSGSASILTMLDPGAPGGSSAINCVPNATLDAGGNISTGGTVTIGGQTATGTTIQTVNTLANLTPCPTGQVLTKTDATTYACVAGSANVWQFTVSGYGVLLRGIGTYDTSNNTFTGRIFCGPAQTGYGSSVNCGDHGAVTTYCASDTYCANCYAGTMKCRGITGQYYENVDVVNLPISGATTIR